MKKIFLAFFLLFTFSIIGFSQPATVTYGNNAAAGHYYNIRGIKMYCEIYGVGKPLLLIHGNGGSIQSFKQNIAFFATKYQVIALDSRAQGKSVDRQDSLSFEMMADDEAALLDSLHIDSAYVIGHSDGGINALLLAMRHPKKVSKLASSGANLWPDSTALLPSFWKSEQQRFATTDAASIKTEKQKNDWKLFLLDWLQPNISLASLSAVHCPSLIISGDHDLITLEHTLLIYKNLPAAYLWILPNSGHGTMREHDVEFNQKVDEFFSPL